MIVGNSPGSHRYRLGEGRPCAGVWEPGPLPHVTYRCLQGLTELDRLGTSSTWWQTAAVHTKHFVAWWVRNSSWWATQVTWYIGSQWLSILSLLRPSSRSRGISQKESSHSQKMAGHCSKILKGLHCDSLRGPLGNRGLSEVPHSLLYVLLTLQAPLICCIICTKWQSNCTAA